MQYDGLSNITRKTQNDVIEAPAGSGQFTTQLATTYNNTYTYSRVNAGPHAPTTIGSTAGSETVTYDADGNTDTTTGTFGPSRSFRWTEDDRMRSEIDSGFTSTYLYDAAGNRTHKRRSTLETWYVNPLYQIKNSLTETKHIMMGDQRIVSAVATISNRADAHTAGASTLFYYHPDHLRSTQFTTGANASLLQHDEYFATGEVWFGEQKNNDARNTQPWLFNAKELDETGLYYFGARYFNPKYSLWVTPDPILDEYMQGSPNGGAFAPRNLALYTYSWNSPVTLHDPDGRFLDPSVIEEAEHEVQNSGLPPQAKIAIGIGLFLAFVAVGGNILGPPSPPPQNTQPPPAAPPAPAPQTATGGGGQQKPPGGGTTVAAPAAPQPRGNGGGNSHPPNLQPFKKGGKTAGVLRTGAGDQPLESGWSGPAQSVPKGTSGFDIVTRTHVEGHAAASMRASGASEATLYINNPEICSSCGKLLPKMLPPGARLTVVTPTGSTTFTGIVKP